MTVSHSTRSALLLQCLSRPGPSRLASRSQPCSHCLRHASSSSTSPTNANDAVQAGLHSAYPGGAEGAESPNAGRGFGGDRDAVIKVDGFKQWFATVAQKYRYPPDSGPNWISGRTDYPYPSNPSFRPPTPLSDSLRERIYQDHFHPDTLVAPTIAQLAAKYAISKSRIGAVLKLKAVEKGWEREGKILQTPFQESMEKYLGCRSGGYDTRWGSRDDIELRRQQPSYLSELAEETAHQEYLEANPDGDVLSQTSPHSARGGLDTSAFTRRDTVESDNGVERGVWEFRDESQTPAATSPGGHAELDVPYNRVFTDEAMDAFEAREAKRASAKAAETTASNWEGKDRLKDIHQASKRSVIYRFVDINSDSAKKAGVVAMSTKGLGTKQDRPGKASSDKEKERRRVNKQRRKEVALERIRLHVGEKPKA